MAGVVDLATGERQVLNDIRGAMNATDVGPSFQSMSSKPREILELLGKTPRERQNINCCCFSTSPCLMVKVSR